MTDTTKDDDFGFIPNDQTDHKADEDFGFVSSTSNQPASPASVFNRNHTTDASRKAAENNTLEAIKDAAASFALEAPLGFGDEIAAGMRTAMGVSELPGTGMDKYRQLLQLYRDNKEDIRNEQKEREKRSPVATIVGQLASVFALPMGALGDVGKAGEEGVQLAKQALEAGRTAIPNGLSSAERLVALQKNLNQAKLVALANKMKEGAKVGGALGLAYGAGDSSADLSKIAENPISKDALSEGSKFLGQTVGSGLKGAALGAATPVVIGAVKKIPAALDNVSEWLQDKAAPIRDMADAYNKVRAGGTVVGKEEMDRVANEAEKLAKQYFTSTKGEKGLEKTIGSQIKDLVSKGETNDKVMDGLQKAEEKLSQWEQSVVGDEDAEKAVRQMRAKFDKFKKQIEVTSLQPTIDAETAQAQAIAKEEARQLALKNKAEVAGKKVEISPVQFNPETKQAYQTVTPTIDPSLVPAGKSPQGAAALSSEQKAQQALLDEQARIQRQASEQGLLAKPGPVAYDAATDTLAANTTVPTPEGELTNKISVKNVGNEAPFTPLKQAEAAQPTVYQTAANQKVKPVTEVKDDGYIDNLLPSVNATASEVGALSKKAPGRAGALYSEFFGDLKDIVRNSLDGKMVGKRPASELFDEANTRYSKAKDASRRISGRLEQGSNYQKADRDINAAKFIKEFTKPENAPKVKQFLEDLRVADPERAKQFEAAMTKVGEDYRLNKASNISDTTHSTVIRRAGTLAGSAAGEAMNAPGKLVAAGRSYLPDTSNKAISEAIDHLSQFGGRGQGYARMLSNLMDAPTRTRNTMLFSLLQRHDFTDMMNKLPRKNYVTQDEE
jgi:hypothetical protein